MSTGVSVSAMPHARHFSLFTRRSWCPLLFSHGYVVFQEPLHPAHFLPLAGSFSASSSSGVHNIRAPVKPCSRRRFSNPARPPNKSPSAKSFRRMIPASPSCSATQVVISIVLLPTRTSPPGSRCSSHKLFAPEIGKVHPPTAHVVLPSIAIVHSSFFLQLTYGDRRRPSVNLKSSSPHASKYCVAPSPRSHLRRMAALPVRTATADSPFARICLTDCWHFEGTYRSIQLLLGQFPYSCLCSPLFL